MYFSGESGMSLLSMYSEEVCILHKSTYYSEEAHTTPGKPVLVQGNKGHSREVPLRGSTYYSGEAHTRVWGSMDYFEEVRINSGEVQDTSMLIYNQFGISLLL